MGHIQPIVPVGIFKAQVVVVANVKEGCQMLDKQMFQHSAVINSASFRAKLRAAFGCPAFIYGFCPMGELVFKIGFLTQQKTDVASVVNIEFGRQEGPGTVIHPHAGDIVAVGFEFAGSVTDDGGVAAIYANTGEVAEQYFIQVIRLHE